MPYDLTYRNGGFHIIHRGQVSINEINEVNGLIHSHQEFDFHAFQLINLLDADFSRVNERDAKVPGSSDSVASRMRRNVKVAIVATDPTTLAFCKQYISTAKRYGSDWTFRIFPDLDSALKWIEG